MSSGVPYCRACAIWASTLCWSSGCTRVNSVAKSGSGASAQMPNRVRISSETYRRRSRTRISHSPTWATRWRKSNRSPSVERGARAGLVVGGGMAQQSGALGTRLRKAWRYRGQDRARRRRRACACGSRKDTSLYHPRSGRASDAPIPGRRNGEAPRARLPVRIVVIFARTFVRIFIAGLQYAFLPPVMARHSSMFPPIDAAPGARAGMGRVEQRSRSLSCLDRPHAPGRAPCAASSP